MKLPRIAILLLALGLTSASATAQETKDAAPKAAVTAEVKPLTLGDPAPALAIKNWLNGSPIWNFQPGRIYVVEFWATWCGPCVASMPHLTELQKKYVDKVTIVGVTSEDPRNTLDGVKKMVAEKAGKMGYTVAWDDGRKTNEAFMAAANQHGIPCCFVVNGEGKVVYIGGPTTLDDVLPKVIDGSFDIEAARVELAAATKLEAEIMKYRELVEAGKGDEALKLAKGLLSDSRLEKDPSFLNEVAWTIVDPETKLGKQDVAFALQCAEKANELTKGEDASVLDTLAHAYAAKGDLKKAVDTEKRAVELAESPMKEDLQKALVKLEAKAAGK